MFVERKEEKVDDGKGGQRNVAKEALIFPRFHQLDAVRNVVATSRNEGSGVNYLIQHSAGSGKTNSISWLSHRLASLHDDKDQKVFDCVIVITDRRVLDQQLQDAIYQIEHAQGVVKAIDQDSKQLAAALIDGTKIVITTLQKFPFVLRGLLHAAGAESQEQATDEAKRQAKEWEAAIGQRKYAVIVDEAHSSQTGETARELKAILGQGIEDGEEGFILDVLTNYTTYATYYKLLKAAEDDPTLPKKKAARVLAKFMSLHPHNIEQKTEVIVEHFRRSVMHRLRGRAKAMVVTSSRLHAVRYKLAFERYLAENGYVDIRPLVAFSGTVRDPESGIDYTEPGMNTDIVTGKSISEAALPARFETPDYQVLLVANKYQTGFDQPLLHTMYVDKRLDGVQAVQTLSRLNRMIPGKDAPFVLDFVNDAEDIFRAFKPYFDKTEIAKASDPSQLEGLKHELDQAQIYHWSEVEAEYVVSPVNVGTGKAKEDKAPLSEIIEVLNERFGTQFNEEDRLFFQQIKERAVHNRKVVETALANPLDKFELGVRKLIEDLMIERMTENDKIVTRYMGDKDFQSASYPILAREIFEAVRNSSSDAAGRPGGSASASV